MDIPDIEPLFRAVHEMLTPGGVFVFSTLHPCFIPPGRGFTEDGMGVIITDYMETKAKVRTSRTFYLSERGRYKVISNRIRRTKTKFTAHKSEKGVIVMPNWNYCVVARFDEATDKKLTDLKAMLLSEGYGGVATNWPPHITLSVYEAVSSDALKVWTAEYAQTQKTFDVVLGSCGILPPGGDKTETAVLYVAPCSSRQLIDFYFGFHAKLDEYCGDSGWFYSAAFGHPAIHATIGIVEVKRLQRALELVFAGGIFGKSQIKALEVYKYPMELVARYELGVRTIVVIPWQEEWPDEFAKIQRELDEVLSDTVISIEHVGSTSVEGLAAKPIIDIDIVIEESKFEAVKERLASIGYIHNGDQGVPKREAFNYTGKDHLMKHHLYVCPKDSPELHRHLALRDCLRQNPVLRDKYSNIKLEMAKKHPHDIDAYIDGKGDVVREIYRVWEEQKCGYHS